MSAKQIIDGIWQVGGGSWGSVVGALSVDGSGNVYLVGGGPVGQGEYALIDAGTAKGVPAVLANAAGVGAAPGRIRQLVLTHCHSDHIDGAAELLRLTGAEAVASELAARALSGDPAARKMLMLDGPALEVCRPLGDGQTIRFGPYEFRALLAPGHMPDCLCLVGQVGSRKAIFTGDAIIGDQGSAKGIVGWLDGHWHSNPKHYLKSIQRIAACRADLLLPGHGLPIAGQDSVAESLAHCAQRIQQLLAIPDLHTMMPLDLSD